MPRFYVLILTNKPANELSRQWAVRISTAHRLEIRRALHLLPSDNKDLGYANKKIPNLVIEDSGLRYVGMTGFEPATTRPPDNYNYCTDNADYLLVTYLLLSSGLIVGLITA